MQYHLNITEMDFLKENLKEALKNINGVRGQIDIGNRLQMAYDHIMLCTGALEMKTKGNEES